MFVSLRFNILYGVLFAVGVIAPDFLLQLFGVGDRAQFDILFTLFLFVFGFTLSLTKKSWFVYVVLLLILFMETIQLGNICYFGKPLSPLDIGKVFHDFDTVFEVLEAEWIDFYYLPLVLFFSYGMLIFVYNRWHHMRKRFYKLSYAPLIVIAFLSIKPIRAFYRESRFFFPSPTRTSLHNSINAFSCFLTRVVLLGNEKDTMKIAKSYKPYKVVDIANNTKVKNIIIVMGETLSYEHMSLYGYHRRTTPKLESLKNDDNFLIKRAISASVSTMVSLPMFFNCIREPVNIRELERKKANIFRLAKQRGFKTFFYSAQVSGILYEAGVENIDETIVDESFQKINFRLKKDDHLLTLLEEANIAERNFFVINPKSLHSPYECCYSHRPEFNSYPVKGSRVEKAVNAYDNAMLYHDDWLFNLFQRVKKKFKGETYIIVTGDHSELFNYNGLYGHNHLLPEGARVPFMLYAVNTDGSVIKKIKSKKDIYSHYDISKIVIELLGYKLDNPNESDGEYYIQGSNLYQPYYIKYLIKGNVDVKFSKPIAE